MKSMQHKLYTDMNVNHPKTSCEVNRFIRHLLIAGSGMTSRQERKLGMRNIFLHDIGQRRMFIDELEPSIRCPGET
jgi:hypothetical protein